MPAKAVFLTIVRMFVLSVGWDLTIVRMFVKKPAAKTGASLRTALGETIHSNYELTVIYP
jgi:hypothetical protein